MYHECKNIELIVKLGANLDSQDCQGHTAIHICLIRLIQEPELFEDYKRIIKTLLFSGARRDILTNKKETALDLLEHGKDVLSEAEYKSLRFILSDYKECVCF